MTRLTTLEDVTLTSAGSPVAHIGQDVGGKDTSGRLHTSVVSCSGGSVMLQLAYFEYGDRPEGEVGCLDHLGSPVYFGPRIGLVGRLRIGVYTREGVTFGELGGAEFVADKGPARFKAQKKTWPTLPELDRRAGGSVAGFLSEKGIVRLGSREELFGDRTRMRNRLAARFQDASAPAPPMWVFVATRVVPLVRQWEEGL